MDINTAPRMEFLQHNFDLHRKSARSFRARMRNIECNPEPPADVKVVVYDHEGKPSATAIRDPYPHRKPHSEWYSTGWEEPSDWNGLVDTMIDEATGRTEVYYVTTLDTPPRLW